MSSSPLCRRASGRCIVRLCKPSGFLSRPEARRQGGGAGVYSGSSPLWASADCPEFPEVTPPDARSYSALCLRSFPALSRLPSGQAQGVAAEDRHNSPRRQSRRLPPPPAGRHYIPPIWTSYTTCMDTITYGIRIQTYSHVHSSFPTWTGHSAHTDRIFRPYGQEPPNRYSA